MNFNKVIFDIIVVAGQSNAEGNGLCFDKDKRVVFDDQYEMIDSNPCFIEPNTETHELICTFPVVTKIRKLQEREVDDKFFSDFSIAFAQDYLEKGYLKNGHKLLIVKAAVGGSGFTRKQQGVENVLYKRLVAMVDEALKLNKENKIVAFLWHQGEHDAFENIGRSKKYVYSFYKKSFLKQTVAFLNLFKKFNFPVITGGFCHSWRNLKENLINCKMVEKALIESCKEIGYASFVPSDGLKSNMETIKNCNDNIHFNRDSLFRLGHRYFERWEEMVNSRIFTYKKAKWIWNEKLSNIDAYCEFEVNFNIDKLGKYILYLSCAGTYAVYLNGKLITSMQSSDYSDYKYVDKICLERLNKKNKIIIQCWNQGVESYIFKKENSGLIFEIRDFDDKPTLWSSKSTPSRVMNEFKNGYKKYITTQQGLSFLFDFNAISFEVIEKIHLPLNERITLVCISPGHIYAIEFCNSSPSLASFTFMPHIVFNLEAKAAVKAFGMCCAIIIGAGIFVLREESIF